ncbi:MAG: alanine racemase [Legionellales bacterium]|nr:alanine racemase [Legionellales bacterium]
MRPTIAKINSAALLHNVARVREFAPNANIIAMVKANAYGHGIVNVASVLNSKVEAFGVASLEEALILRQANIQNPIILMQGFFHADELPLIDQHQLQLVIHEDWQIQALKNYLPTQPFGIWVKINTGMYRLGFPPSKLHEVMMELQSLNYIQQPCKLMTHLASADQDTDFSQQQIDLFYQQVKNFPGEKSITNSAGLMRFPQEKGNWVRPGLMLYGISPFADQTSLDLNLKPVMTLQSAIIAIKHCKTGDFIGYGNTYQCQKSMRVGIVAIGYGDGYPWRAQTGTPVLINGHRSQILGRVSMDMLCVDLSDFPETKIHDPVILWGDDLPVDEIAHCAGTISYDLLCRVSQRVRYAD